MAKTGKDGLLLWCKNVTVGYANVKIENFHTSWRDGLGFCAIIHKHRPEAIDFASLVPGDVLKNNQIAFSTALKLGIPALLDAEDMLMEKPEQFSIITYLAQYYNKFKGGGGGIAGIKESPLKPGQSLANSNSNSGHKQSVSKSTLKCSKCKECLSGNIIEFSGGIYHDKCFICFKCGKSLIATGGCIKINDNAFCSTCGNIIKQEQSVASEVLPCNSCRTPLKLTSKFCFCCGVKIDNVVNTNNNNNNSSPSLPKQNTATLPKGISPSQQLREEKERIEKEKKEKLERDKVEIEKGREEERKRKEQEEKEERLRIEQRQREEKLRKEKEEREERDEKERQDRIEKERIEKEEKEAIERELKEKEERERILAEEERIEKEKQLERERREKEENERIENERLEKIRIEKERLELEAKIERELLEQERMIQEQERLEIERLQEERRRIELEKEEQDKFEKARLEELRIESERIEMERLEEERLEKERIEQERIELERIEQERIEKENQEKERERERQIQERLEKERARLELERIEKERLEQERIEQERIEKETQEEFVRQMVLEQAAQRKKEREQKEKERKEREEAEREERERIQREKEEKDKEDRERERILREKERVERKEQRERERKERDDKERLAREQREREREENARIQKELREKRELELKLREEERQKERERLKQEREEQRERERLEREREREEKERERLAKLEAERIEREKQEQERIEKERLDLERKEKLEIERKERIERERIQREKERKEREEQRERERLERESERERQKENERLARLEAERIENERIENEKREKERLEKEKLEKSNVPSIPFTFSSTPNDQVTAPLSPRASILVQPSIKSNPPTPNIIQPKSTPIRGQIQRENTEPSSTGNSSPSTRPTSKRRVVNNTINNDDTELFSGANRPTSSRVKNISNDNFSFSFDNQPQSQPTSQPPSQPPSQPQSQQALPFLPNRPQQQQNSTSQPQQAKPLPFLPQASEPVLENLLFPVQPDKYLPQEYLDQIEQQQHEFRCEEISFTEATFTVIDYAKYESNISGWLKKKDSKVSRFEISFGFSKKWFSLQDSRLLYHDHELKSNEMPEGIIPLNLAHLIESTGSKSFKIHFPEQVYEIECHNTNERNTWVKELREARAVSQKLLEFEKKEAHEEIDALSQRKEGFVEIKYSLLGWTKLYLVAMDGILSVYYSNKPGGSRKHKLPLYGCEIQVCENPDRKYTFKLMTPNATKKKLLFSFKDQEDMIYWNLAIQRQRDEIANAIDNLVFDF